MKKTSIIQSACRDIGKVSSGLKKHFEDIDKDEVELLDIAIKDLINIRSVIDFSNNKQLTHNNWNEIKEEVQ